MNLERAFKQLRAGLVVAYPDQASVEKRRRLYDAPDRALEAYRAGDERGGAIILQDDFQDAIFKGG